jgi:hypothetical protein
LDPLGSEVRIFYEPIDILKATTRAGATPFTGHAPDLSASKLNPMLS